MKLKVGVFGGTFDPFTEAHMAIVKAALDQKLVDEVHIIPSVVDYYREDKERWLSNDKRLDVICKFIEYIENDINYNGKIFVDGIEYDFAEHTAPYIVNKRRFIDTLNQFIYSFIDTDDIEFYTIIGTDSYKNFKTWTDWEEILRLSKLIVVNGRDGEDIQLDIPKIDLRIDSKFLEMSSTKIREQYKDQSCEQYVADILNNHVIESVQCKTPIFDLVKKTVNGLGFRPVGINSPDWVTVIVEHNGKYKMVKQLRYGLMTEQMEFTCGMVDKGEEPINAAIRELREETGIELLNESQIKYLGKYAANPGFMNNYMHYFYVNLNTAEFVQVETEFDEHEKLTSEFVDINKVESMIENCDSNSASVFMSAGLYLVKNMKMRNRNQSVQFQQDNLLDVC